MQRQKIQLIFEANWSEIFFSIPEHGRGSRKTVSRSLLKS